MLRYRFDERLFSEEGLCGEIGQTLQLLDGYFLGKALGAFLLFKHRHAYACIGYDGRPHSAPLEREVIRGLLESGVRVLSFGCCPTPLVRFAAKELSIALALSVSGGSLPMRYNGIKVMLEGEPLIGERARQIQNIAASGNFRTAAGGGLVKAEGAEAYATRLCASLRVPAARVYWHRREEWTPLFSQLLERLGGGQMRTWQPSEQAREQTDTASLAPLMQQTLRDEPSPAIGFLFNSDGSELGVVDEEGKIVPTELFFPLLVQSLRAKSGKRERILVDPQFDAAALAYMQQQSTVLRCSAQELLPTILTDDRVLAAASHEGRVFIKDNYYGFDDALYAALRLLDSLGGAREGKTLAERLKPIERARQTAGEQTSEPSPPR